MVLADLRGYGDSSLPDPGPNLINYSFRVMAEDMLEVMDNLGYQRFFLVGHDRGFPVCDDYVPPFAFGGTLRQVVLEAPAFAPRDRAQEIAIALRHE